MLKKFPGLTDVHVHLRDPGFNYKEDIASGTLAAISGGFTTIIDMPNNKLPTITKIRLNEKITLAKTKSKCDLFFHFGTDGNNFTEFPYAINNKYIKGLKVYLNHTTGSLLVNDKNKIENIFKFWNTYKPILVHAEGKKLLLALSLAHFYKRRLHICHISKEDEVKNFIKAKKNGQNVTAGVTPHHLFLDTQNSKNLSSLAFVKPELGLPSDRDYLWMGLKENYIDIIESDHAPHLKSEKTSDAPVFGMPGLETTLGIMLRSVKEKIITIEKLISLLCYKPNEIFDINLIKNTFIMLDPDKPYIIGENGYKSKSNWSQFEGWEVYGKVVKTVIRGKCVYNLN